LKSSARECVDRRLREIAFVLICREGAVRHRAVQGVCRLREKSQSCVSEQKLWRIATAGNSAESRELQHLDVIEDFPQGARAGNLVEVEVTLQISGRIGL
jgi:hypothetical protein